MGRFKIPFGVTLFIAIWLLILCVPVVREIGGLLKISMQLRGNSLEIEDRVPRQLAREFPNDPVPVAWAAENQFYRGQKNAVKAAFARFPADLPMRALRLQTTASKFRESNDLTAQKEEDRAELAQCAQIAREGGQLDPDNVFWPWIEAAFDFSIGQNEAAARAFERAQNCTRFDNYAYPRLQNRLRFLERHRDPSFEQKLSLFFSGQPLPDLTALRKAGELASTRAARLRASGQHARALALENGVLGAMRLMRRDGPNIIAVLSSERGARESLGEFLSIAKPKQTANYVDPTIYGDKVARAWDAYARANGRPDLAVKAAFVAEPSASREWGEYVGSSSFAQFGLEEPWATVATAGPMGLLMLAVAIVAGALLWALATLLPWDEASPTRGQVVACANFSFWLLLGICVVAVVRLNIYLNPFISFENGEMTAFWTVADFFGLTFLCWLLPVWFVALQRGRRWRRSRPADPRDLPGFWNRARVIAWATGALGAALIVSNGRGLWDDTPFQYPVAAGIAGAGLALALSLELARWNLAGTRLHPSANGEKSPPKLYWSWAPWLLWSLAFMGAGALIRGVSEGVIAFDQIVRAILTLLALAGALFTGWKNAPDHFRWQLAHRALGVLVVLWSLALLFFAVGLMPLRAQLNRNLDRQIQLGEIAWMREQIAKTK